MIFSSDMPVGVIACEMFVMLLIVPNVRLGTSQHAAMQMMMLHMWATMVFCALNGNRVS